jgi:hypothetical protein
METGIPHEVQECRDTTLRNNAIAAIHRGTVQEQNRTLLECIRFNDKTNLGVQLEARKEEFTKWKQWFKN